MYGQLSGKLKWGQRLVKFTAFRRCTGIGFVVRRHVRTWSYGIIMHHTGNLPYTCHTCSPSFQCFSGRPLSIYFCILIYNVLFQAVVLEAPERGVLMSTQNILDGTIWWGTILCGPLAYAWGLHQSYHNDSMLEMVYNITCVSYRWPITLHKCYVQWNLYINTTLGSQDQQHAVLIHRWSQYAGSIAWNVHT